MHPRPLTYTRYRRFLFTVNDCFLSSDVKTSAAINYYIQCPENVEQALDEFYTLLIDLRQNEQQVWNKIYHRSRAEINSFLSNQSYTYHLEFNPTKKQLAEFIRLFNTFARFKNIRRAEGFRLRAYLAHHILAISYIKQNGQYLCINFYRLTKQRATNLYSFHLKHLPNSGFSASHYGRAHRALHWRDIQQFKKTGVLAYDFCGWYNGHEDQELLNINKFKEQFAGEKVKEYSGVIYKNIFLKFLKKLRS